MRFSPSNYTPQDDSFPKADVPFRIESAFERPTSKGNGKLIEVEIICLEAPVKGRKLRAFLNVENPNPKAAEIGRRELNDLCHCVGQLADWEPDPHTGVCDVLVGRSGVARVGPREDKPEYGEVKRWLTSAVPSVGYQGAPSAAPSRPAATVQAPPPRTPARPAYDDEVPF